MVYTITFITHFRFHIGSGIEKAMSITFNLVLYWSILDKLSSSTFANTLQGAKLLSKNEGANRDYQTLNKKEHRKLVPVTGINCRNYAYHKDSLQIFPRQIRDGNQKTSPKEA